MKIASRLLQIHLPEKGVHLPNVKASTLGGHNPFQTRPFDADVGAIFLRPIHKHGIYNELHVPTHRAVYLNRRISVLAGLLPTQKKTPGSTSDIHGPGLLE